MSNPAQLFSELLASPLGDLIASIGKGVGEAQAALDEGSLRQTLEIYNLENEDGKSEDEKRLMQLIRSVGYQPTFYTIPETECEAQVSLSMSLKNETKSAFDNSIVSKRSMFASPINAGNVNQFGLTANAVAKLKFKIVPVPPPSGVPEMRIMPKLIDRAYNDETKGFLDSIGVSYQLDEVSQKNIDENPTKNFIIISQDIPEKSIIETGATVVLSLG